MEKNTGWIGEVKKLSSIVPVYLLSGNIRDLFLTKDDAPVSIDYYICDALKEEGYEAFIKLDLIDKFKEIHIENSKTSEVINAFKLNNINQINEREVFEKLRDILTKSEVPTVIIFDYASRIVPNPENLKDNSLKAFTILEKFSYEIPPKDFNGKILKNILILLLQKENDIPSWVSYNNPKVKSLVVPKPSRKVREKYINKILTNLRDSSVSDEDYKIGVEEFINSTEKMTLNDINAIYFLARKEKIGVKEIHSAVRAYKTGVKEDRWKDYLVRIKEEGREILNAEIKGQDKVKDKVFEVLLRSSIGLSGLHIGKNINRPKAVLMFAGPTGVGKTQMAKTITKMIFGEEDNYIRFDMSEFKEPHTSQRLIGSPPGYVGYEQGGELTNAVRENPFSLILFDEIEKAHPRILDMFLQILDDGRLTDARGDTVYFSETIIVFTTNLGVYKITETGEKIPLISLNDDYGTIEKRIIESIENFFRFDIGRPEIFNRIGKDNVLVFDFIRKDSAEQIFNKFLSNFIKNVKEKYEININISPEKRKEFLDICTDDLIYGGRGISQNFESKVIPQFTEIIRDAIEKGNKEVVI